LLAASVEHGERVFATGDSLFYRAAELTSPFACDAAEGSCLRQVQEADGVERTSRVDSTDLATKEVVELAFPHTPSAQGLVLSARNSLVTTYLFYQTLAYAGSRYGDMLSLMEQGTRAGAQSQFGMASRLGGIEVQVRDVSNAWTTIGVFGEPGPIATDTKVIPLPTQGDGDRPLRVRLRMAKGSWRIDWAAIAALRGTVKPLKLVPVAVTAKGTLDSSALHSLRGGEGTRRLVSLPGADYRMQFRLPDSTSRYELFLESEGYYYEWMRREWLPEENAALAAAAIADPAGSLRRLAPTYHAREGMMDSLFFHSRFTRGGANATH
jgi:hypothetical protein